MEVRIDRFERDAMPKKRRFDLYRLNTNRLQLEILEKDLSRKKLKKLAREWDGKDLLFMIDSSNPPMTFSELRLFSSVSL